MMGQYGAAGKGNLAAVNCHLGDGFYALLCTPWREAYEVHITTKQQAKS